MRRIQRLAGPPYPHGHGGAIVSPPAHVRPGTVDLIAAADGERAGFLLLLTDVPDEVTQQQQAFVAFMAVAEPFRRMGVGGALLAAAQTEAERFGLTHLSLMVSADNAAARSLYAAHGFAEERLLLTKIVS